MKIKIPNYLKEREVWKLRSIVTILPAILSYAAGLWQFAIMWCIVIPSMLFSYDIYQAIITSNIETFK